MKFERAYVGRGTGTSQFEVDITKAKHSICSLRVCGQDMIINDKISTRTLLINE